MTHRCRINKLQIYGIHGQALPQIESFFTCHQQVVLCDGVRSDYSAVTSGVRQGIVVSSTVSVDPHTAIPLAMTHRYTE